MNQKSPLLIGKGLPLFKEITSNEIEASMPTLGVNYKN